MINTVIVENDQHYIDDLKKMLSENFSDIKILDICKSKKDAIRQIRNEEPDLVFMDIELNDDKEGGFNILKETRELSYEVIFTTSYNNYALKAFKFSAIDFLLKPVNPDELRDAVERFKKRVNADSQKSKEVLINNLLEKNNSLKTICIPKIGSELECYKVEEIIYCEARGNASVFFLSKKREIESNRPLDWAEERLLEFNFFRSHRSYLVNLNHIIKFGRDGDVGYVKLAEAEKIIPVSRRKVQELQDRLGL